MLKHCSLLMLFLTSFSLYSQFDCNNIKLLGIHTNNRNTDQLSLLLTNKSPVPDGNGNAYTALHLVSLAGDTLASSSIIFQLPNSLADTFVYNVPLDTAYDHIYELPDYRTGLLRTAFPDCEITYAWDSIPEPDLPLSTHLNCSDFKIAGIYETALGGIRNYSLLLTNTNADSLRNWALGYTNLQVVDEQGMPLSEATGPSFIVPMQYGDTIVLHVDFETPIIEGQEMLLQMSDPDCLVPFHTTEPLSIREPDALACRVYPNPTAETIQVETTRPFKSIELRTPNGQLIKRTARPSLDVSGLRAGTYFVVFIFEDKQVVRRVVVTH